TVGTCIGINLTAPDQYMAIIIPGRMYAGAYRERGLHAKNLSRTVEDAGTMTSPLVPWGTCGVTMTLALGVSTFTYMPFAFLNLLMPVIAILWAYRGIAQAEVGEEPAGG